LAATLFIPIGLIQANRDRVYGRPFHLEGPDVRLSGSRNMAAVGYPIRRSVSAPERAPRGVANSRRKRAFDVALSTLALFVLLPLLVLVAAAIAVESGGPVIFRQRRSGLNGQPFVIYKFRTMSVAEDGPSLRQAQANDARVTRVGRLLRFLSIDELPQLVNVLRGEMSVVGPRPHALDHDAQWSLIDPAYNERFRARPGLTGLAQVRGYRGLVQNDECLRKRVAADREYVESWSLRTDLAIILRTVPLLLGDAQAF
jgi:putative colanic acid biosynthesis UDP-glucose lipid carrier transferase